MRGRIRTFIDLFLRQAPLRLGYTHRKMSDIGCQILDRFLAADLSFSVQDLKSNVVRAAGFEPANTCSQDKPVWPSAERPDVLNWLRGKESNLYFLVQSQASCRLDDPEKYLAGKAGLEPAKISLKN